MKNEDKIIELLTEMIRKSDRHEERMKQYEEGIQRQEERIKLSEERLNQLDDIASGTLTLLKELMKRSGETDELRDRIKRLEKYTGLK